MSEALELLHSSIADHLERIRRYFKVPVKLTIFVRAVDHPDGKHVALQRQRARRSREVPHPAGVPEAACAGSRPAARARGRARRDALGAARMDRAAKGVDLSERYKPRDLKRAAAQLWADPNYPQQLAERRRQDTADRLDTRTRAKLRGAPVVVECRHGVPWLSCNLCSKVRTR